MTVIAQRQLCDRLKREATYGIMGDPEVSVATPTSDLMKLTYSFDEFIASSEYDAPDKEEL